MIHAEELIDEREKCANVQCYVNLACRYKQHHSRLTVTYCLRRANAAHIHSLNVAADIVL